MMIWEEKTKNHYHDGGLDIALFKNFTKMVKKIDQNLPRTTYGCDLLNQLRNFVSREVH